MLIKINSPYQALATRNASVTGTAKHICHSESFPPLKQVKHYGRKVVRFDRDMVSIPERESAPIAVNAISIP